jgi:PAS domain S-box-containing protein
MGSWRRKPRRFEEGRFRALIEQSLDAIAVIEPDGRVSFVSPSIVRVLGYTADEFIKLNAFEVVHPDERDQAIERLAEIMRQPGSSQTVVNRARHKDGSWRWIETVSTNQLENPSVRAVVANFRDITDRRRVEDALKDADRRKHEFIAILAHELRNPLAAINNAVQLSLRQVREEDAEWSKLMIQRQVKHLARLIDDLLEVSRINHGKIELRKQEMDLALVIARAVETVTPLMEQNKHNLMVSIGPGPMNLVGDPARIEQVLENLLANAAKYTEEGGQITLTARREPELIVTVKDNGIGISTEMLPRIFDLFAQADRSMDRSQGGLGIGLTLVKKLVEMHGGTATAASDGSGKGSEFTVRLPATWEAVAEEQTVEAGRSVTTDTGLRVLVVDDNRDAAAGLTRLLQASGFRVTTVADGTAALPAARADRPDVILMDIGLPGMDGYRVAEQLRNDASHHGVLLIAISGYGQDHDRRRSREAGFDHHLVKPVDYDSLLSLLARPKS